jgi:hypothetical protein
MKLKLVAVGCILAGFMIAWGIYRPKPAKPEPAAPEVRQKDGSLVLERAPSGVSSHAKPGTPALKPAGIVPAGATIEREIQIQVAPRMGSSPSGAPSQLAGGPQVGSSIPRTLESPSVNSLCPPLTIDLSLVRLKDQTHRVIASSPDGTIVGGLDVPVDPPAPFKIPRWSAEALVGYDSHAGRNVFGGAVSYGRGPFVVQGGVIGGTAFAGAGIRF